MNILLVLHHLSVLAAALAVLMAPSALCAALYGEWFALRIFGLAAAATLGIGGLLWIVGRRHRGGMFLRDAIGMVVLGWLLISFIGGLPYWFGGYLGFVDALFESISGVTTTGSTVIADIEAMPKSLLFWRAFTHFIGGMGIVVIFLEILPYMGAGGKLFLRSESSAPETRPWSPSVRETVGVLTRVYLALTALQTVLMMLAGMSLYDALCHSFATLASGGFSPRQASLAAYDSVALEMITVAFMVLAGTNFGLLFAMAKGDWKAPFRNSEWRAYTLLLTVVTLLVAANTMGLQGDVSAATGQPVPPPNYEHAGDALRNSLFSTVSLATTTGFVTADFDLWPPLAHVLLLIVMIVGGSSGSTAGGLKVVRVVLLVKMVRNLVFATFRPHTVTAVRINGQAVSGETLRQVGSFFALYVFVFTLAVIGLSGIGLPFLSAVSSVAGTLNGVGPGMEHLGAMEDYHLLPDSGKLILCGCMVMGRLEFLSILAMLTPGFWRSN
jgi:trk system potassium uptake protein TrkH